MAFYKNRSASYDGGVTGRSPKTHQEALNMKSTRNDATNQRIERITPQHAVVGIDIAKEVHAAQMTDFRGRVLTARHLSFPNTQEGFEKLLR